MSKKILEQFNDEECLTILELARVALADAEIYDYMVDNLDILDEEMQKLREKITIAMT